MSINVGDDMFDSDVVVGIGRIGNYFFMWDQVNLIVDVGFVLDCSMELFLVVVDCEVCIDILLCVVMIIVNWEGNFYIYD